MKEKIKTFLSICLLIVALPFIITLVFQGNQGEKDNAIITFIAKQFGTENENKSEKEVIETDNETIDVEQYLVGVVANEIPITYEPEMLKAQIVIARTNLFCAIENGLELPQSLNAKQMLKLWGQEGFTENYQMLSNAVTMTKGETIYYNGSYIDAAFHSVSAGKTRTASEVTEKEDVEYLTSVDSHYDIPSQDFLKVIFISKEEFVETLTKSYPDCGVAVDDLMEKIEIKSRDSADYVNEISIGETSMTGEEFRKIFELNSACFYIAEVEGNIRIVTKGLGHGLGLSQYGGNELAKTGKKYDEILNYYYKNIEIKQ